MARADETTRGCVLCVYRHRTAPGSCGCRFGSVCLCGWTRRALCAAEYLRFDDVSLGACGALGTKWECCHLSDRNFAPYEYPAFSEYTVLTLQFAVGDDRFANLVQSAAYLGCILAASLIAQKMGLSGDGQLLSGIVAASIPMAVVEASGTQTDLVVSFWLACAVYWVLAADEFSVPVSAGLVGTSLALATFVKFPALLFAAPHFFVVRFSHCVPGRMAQNSCTCPCSVRRLVLRGARSLSLAARGR